MAGANFLKEAKTGSVMVWWMVLGRKERLQRKLLSLGVERVVECQITMGFTRRLAGEIEITLSTET